MINIQIFFYFILDKKFRYFVEIQFKEIIDICEKDSFNRYINEKILLSCYVF